MNKKKVLIIDDDPRNIFALVATLRRKQFECSSCSSATDGINILEGDAVVDVVLMDMMMPGMDGYEAIPRIRSLQNRTGLKIISVTAQAMAGDMEKCMEAGADGYVSKPVNVDKLMELLGNI